MFPSESDFESRFTFESEAVPLPDVKPFQILILGNFGGDSSRKDLIERRPVSIDRDNFDEVLDKLHVELSLDLQGDGKGIIQLRFNELEDFHPDSLFQNISVFSELRDIRRKLLNPDLFEETARDIRSWFEETSDNSLNFSEASQEKDPIDSAPPIESNNLLDLILNQPADERVLKGSPGFDNSELGRFVSTIISPHLIKIDEKEQTKMVAAVDEIISETMRKILHHPKFQALEASWRGLFFLVRRLETDSELKIFLLDITKAELNQDLRSTDDLRDSFLHKIIVNRSEDENGDGFSVIGGDYFFNVDVEDVALLIRLSKICSAAESPFLSYVRPEIFGINDFSQNIDSYQFTVTDETKEIKLWETIRALPESSFLGLTPMKVLARSPYGAAADQTERFSFEEFNNKFNHQDFLWMNPCFLSILLLGQSFRLNGWEMGQSLRHEVEKLPFFVYSVDGEAKTKPVAEVVLTENILETLLEQGFLALISFRDSDRIRLARFQSISSNLPQLKGQWNL